MSAANDHRKESPYPFIPLDAIVHLPPPVDAYVKCVRGTAVDCDTPEGEPCIFKGDFEACKAHMHLLGECRENERPDFEFVCFVRIEVEDGKS